MGVTIAEAAKLVGKSRRTVYRDVSSGRLSVSHDGAGVAQVDISELIRVYGEIKGERHSVVTVQTPQRGTDDGASRVTAMEVEIAQLRERLADKDRHIDDLRSSIRLLENKVQKADKRPWLLRMFR